jgi:hypothetical protein
MEVDFYQTPYCLTQALMSEMSATLKRWEIDTVCDYCSGAGAIVDVLQANGFKVRCGDIRDQIPIDFFNIGPGDSYGIMNPPFRSFNKWVEHCFKVFEVGFALLGPTTYLQGLGRFNAGGTGIFQNKEYPLWAIYTFNRYPMLSVVLRPDGLIETGMQALSWFVWIKRSEADGYIGDTMHRWLDIDRFVVRKHPGTGGMKRNDNI